MNEDKRIERLNELISQCKFEYYYNALMGESKYPEWVEDLESILKEFKELKEKK